MRDRLERPQSGWNTAIVSGTGQEGMGTLHPQLFSLDAARHDSAIPDAVCLWIIRWTSAPKRGLRRGLRVVGDVGEVSGSLSRIRTYGRSINSRELYR